MSILPCYGRPDLCLIPSVACSAVLLLFCVMSMSVSVCVIMGTLSPPCYVSILSDLTKAAILNLFASKWWLHMSLGCKNRIILFMIASFNSMNSTCT